MELIKKIFYTVLSFIVLKTILAVSFFAFFEKSMNGVFYCGKDKPGMLYKCNIFIYSFDSLFGFFSSMISVGIIFVVIMLYLTYLALMDTYEKIQKWRSSRE